MSDHEQRRLPRDLAHHHLLGLAVELRAQADKHVPEFGGDRALQTPRIWLNLAADLMQAIVRDEDVRAWFDGNVNPVPRILAFEAVQNAVCDGAGTLEAAFKSAADQLGCAPQTVKKHYAEELKARGIRQSDYLLVCKQKRRARDHHGN